MSIALEEPVRKNIPAGPGVWEQDLPTLARKRSADSRLPSTPALVGLFPAEEQESLSAEDSRAFRTVCGILIAVVTSGLLLMAATVLWIVN